MGEKLQSYNKYDPKSIETYAKGLINKTFSEVIKEDQKSIYLISGDNSSVVSEDRYDMHIAGKEDKKNKGNLGQIIEERYFHYKCNSDSRPDFHEAGVELKPQAIPSLLKALVEEGTVVKSQVKVTGKGKQVGYARA